MTIEARSSADPATGRRAAMTRLWAGITAVVGLAMAVSQSAYDPQTAEYGRVLEPWIGDLALVVLAMILVERAFRRGANTFVYAAALALVIALTDFNFSYLTDSTEVGLLIEGLILLGAGLSRATPQSVLRPLAFGNLAAGAAIWVGAVITWSRFEPEGRWLIGAIADGFLALGLLEYLAIRREAPEG